jgi:hypothetical protein
MLGAAETLGIRPLWKRAPQGKSSTKPGVEPKELFNISAKTYVLLCLIALHINHDMKLAGRSSYQEMAAR